MSAGLSRSWTVIKVRDDEHGEKFAVKFVDKANEDRRGYSFSEMRDVSEPELRKDLQSHGIGIADIDDCFAQARSRWLDERVGGRK